MPGQRKYAFLALLVISVSILALYIHRHRQGQTGRIDNVLINSTGFFQKNFSYFTHGVRSLVDHYIWLIGAKEENDRLHDEVQGLHAEMVRLKEVELENKRLKEMIDYKEEKKEELVQAKVIAHDVSNDYFGIRVNRGTIDKVQVGMGVVHPTGVVGRIHRVTDKFADVLALIDPTSNIDGFIQRSRARGILSGQTKTMNCRLKYMDRVEDVAVNDMVLSTGFGHVFPRGIALGTVDNVTSNPNGILQTISVKPSVNIYKLEDVWIVFPPHE